MRKGESVEEVFITPETSIQVFIDEDDVAMWRLCEIKSGELVCGKPKVISLGPIMEILTEKLPGLSRFVVAYVKLNGTSYVKKGGYSGQKVWWTEEMTEEECWANELWPLRN